MAKWKVVRVKYYVEKQFTTGVAMQHHPIICYHHLSISTLNTIQILLVFTQKQQLMFVFQCICKIDYRIMTCDDYMTLHYISCKPGRNNRHGVIYVSLFMFCSATC